MSNYPPGMSAATLLPGEYFSPYRRELIDAPECPLCGAPMEIVADTRDEFEADCTAESVCEGCSGRGDAPEICSRHGEAGWAAPDGKCLLCGLWGPAAGIYDEACGPCEGAGIIRCEGREAASLDERV